MQTRFLSPNQIWIEIPLSAQTCLLVWRAMAACGLREGKINSFEEKHFGPRYSWQPHLVEGRTAQGLFADNVKVQAKLTAIESGTLLEFAAANIKGHSDFGASKRTKRRCVALTEKFLRDAPTEWTLDDAEEKQAAPLAAPSDVGPPVISDAPLFDVIVPIRESSAWSSLGCASIVLVAPLLDRFHWWGPMFLLLAGWHLWNCQMIQRKWSRIAILVFFFYLIAGLYNSWPLLKRWI